MKNQMVMANPRDWCTIAWAAEHIGVSLRTIGRLIADRDLQGFEPLCGSRESKRHKKILYVPEVREYAEAYKRVKGGRTDG